MYTHMHIHSLTHACTHIHRHVCIHACAHTCTMHACVCEHIYLYTCTYMHVCKGPQCTYAYTCITYAKTHVYMCTHVWVCACMLEHMCVQTCVYVSALQAHLHMCVVYRCVCAWAHVYICTCVLHVHIHVHIHAGACMYMNMCTHTQVHILFHSRDEIKVKPLSHVRHFVTPWTAWSTRLLRPWDFPGKSTGVGCHFLLQEMRLGFSKPGIGSRICTFKSLRTPWSVLLTTNLD